MAEPQDGLIPFVVALLVDGNDFALLVHILHNWAGTSNYRHKVANDLLDRMRDYKRLASWYDQLGIERTD